MTWNYSKKTTDLFMAAVQGKPGTHLGEIPTDSASTGRSRAATPSASPFASIATPTIR